MCKYWYTVELVKVVAVYTTAISLLWSLLLYTVPCTNLASFPCFPAFSEASTNLYKLTSCLWWPEMLAQADLVQAGFTVC